MMKQFVCLVAKNVFLTDDMRWQLIELAHDMAQKGACEASFLTEEMAGKVTTTFKEVRVASVSGAQFSAVIDSDLGRGHVNFLVDKLILEKCPICQIELQNASKLFN